MYALAPAHVRVCVRVIEMVAWGGGFKKRAVEARKGLLVSDWVSLGRFVALRGCLGP